MQSTTRLNNLPLLLLLLLLFLLAAPPAAIAADDSPFVGAARSSARTQSVVRPPALPGRRKSPTNNKEEYYRTMKSVRRVRTLLPRCTAAQVPRVAAVAGGCGWIGQWAVTRLVAQGLLLLLAGKAADATARAATLTQLDEYYHLHQYAAYTAHTAVALALMTICSVVGVAGWWWWCSTEPAATTLSSSSSSSSTSNNNWLLETDDAARWLAAVTFGLLLCWDVPVSAVAVAALRKPDMVLHHVGMAGIAWLGAVHLPTPYLYFYLGVSELSSLPLLLYNQLGQHRQFLLRCAAGGGGEESSSSGSPVAVIENLQEIAKVATAVSFTAVRVVGFTAVTVGHFLRDVHRALRRQTTTTTTTTTLPPVATTVWPLQLVAVASIAFTVLQLYWFYTQIFRVVVWGE